MKEKHVKLTYHPQFDKPSPFNIRENWIDIENQSETRHVLIHFEMYNFTLPLVVIILKSQDDRILKL